MFPFGNRHRGFPCGPKNVTRQEASPQGVFIIRVWYTRSEEGSGPGGG